MSDPSQLVPPPLPPLETTPATPTRKPGLFDVKARFAAEMEKQREKHAEKEAARQAEVEAPLRCPGKGWPRKCGSTQIHLSEKKFSAGKAVVGALLVGGIGLIAGAHGRNDIVLTCLKCGHSWTPGK
jgi:hypothetical protein